MNFFRKLIASPRVGIGWVRALDLASQNENEAALDQLIFLDEFFSGKNVEYHVLRARVSYGMGDDSEAVKHAATSISLLENSDRYNEDEKRYLKNYCVILGRKAARTLSEVVEQEAFSKSDILMVHLANVKQSLKISFPLKDHPDWD